VSVAEVLLFFMNIRTKSKTIDLRDGVA